MKQIFKIFILLSCLFPWMRAMADPIVTTVGSGSTCPNDEVVIPVTVSNCNGVAAISLALNFDNTKVSYLGYQSLNSTVSSMLVNASGGTVYMTWANMSNVNVGNGTLVELRFVGIEGSTGLNWNTGLCEYSDATGTVVQSNYSNGSVSVYTVPSITSNPSDRNLVEGQNTTFEVGASGSGLTYQWQVKTIYDSSWQNLSNGGNHSNVYSWRMNVNNVTLDMNGNQYRCVVSGTCPSPVTSEVASLSVEPYIPPIPTIVTSTGSVSTCPDQAFSIPVNVTNCNNVGAVSLALNFNANLVTYVGYENPNSQLSNGTMRVNASRSTVYFTWATANHTLEIGNGELISLVFKSASGNSSLSWNTTECEYSNLSGEALPTSFNGSSLNIYFPPSINTHPADRTVTEGNNTNFSISASGQGLSYQWQMSQDQGISWENLTNGGHYSNVNSSTMYVNNVQMAMEGLRYRCVVNGTCEPSVTSNYGTLHVNGFTPTIVTTAGSLNTCSQTEFGIPISVTNCNNVGAISLALSYNTDILTFAGYEGLNPALNGGQVQVNAANGMVFIAWASVAGANLGDGNLITINFTALSGTIGLNWNTAYCEYANPRGEVLPASYNNGSVSVGDLSFTITKQPTNSTVTLGESTTFSINTSGTTSGYQWQVSQDGGASWSNITSGGHYANPTTKTLKVKNVILEMNGYRYRCVISGSCGVQYTSNAILTVQLPVNYHEIALSADPTEGGTVSGGGAKEEGQPCTVTATPATGYNFVNWTENGTEVSTEASYTFTVSDDRHLVAHFTLQELTITTNVIPVGSGTITGGGTYLYGDHVLLTAIPAEGYVFDNWKENGEVISTNQSISFNAQTDRNLVANFSVMQLNITATAVPASNGTVEGAGIYAYGTTVTLTAIAAEGFELANWMENDTVVSTETTLSFIAQTDRNLVAHFIIQTLNITAETDPEGSGTITGTGTYNYGDPVVLTATPIGNFEFYNWTENGVEVSTQPTISFNAFNHRHLVAHFINSVTIAVVLQPEGSGTISGEGTYNYADPVTLTAQPNTGFAFVNWTENDTVVSTENSISFTAYHDRTIVANFEMIMHHVTVAANINAGGSVSGGGDYQEGTYATVSAVPNAGFEFVHWTENGTAVSANLNYMFAVWAPRNLVAEFELQITDTTAYTCDAFQWHGHTYTSNGVYYDTLSSYLGIDSIVALHLTIYPSYHFEYTETECGNYFWEDSLYTQSGDYTREFQSIYGCDSIRTLHLTIIPLRPLGSFTYMSPANNFIVRYTDREIYWDVVPNANYYDFYFWQGDGNRPNTPTASNVTSTSYHVNGLTHGGVYHWCVVAKNECEESESEIRTFTCQLNPSMTVVPNGWFDFGEVDAGQTSTKTVYVSGTALTENISYDYLDNAWGQDASFFQITPSNWSPTNGGLLHINFTPEATKLYYNSAIRIASGSFVDTLYFTGSLANRYVFTTNVDGDVFSANDNITITGHVEDVLGNPAPDLGVNIYLIVMGNKTTATVMSDANGNYSTTYTPRYSESGYYQVGSCAYGTNSNVVHDAFDIPGMSRVSSDFITWQPYQYETLTGAVEIRNRSRIPLNNIQVNPISLPDGCSVSFTGVSSLGPLETGLLSYVVTGSQVTAGNSYEEAVFQVTADNGITMDMTCYYYCRQLRGVLEVYPPSISTTMQRNTQKILSFKVTNNGNGETGQISVSVPSLDWMSLVGDATMESLQVGDSCSFSIMLSPDSHIGLNPYSGNIAINCANGSGFSIPYQIMAVADTTATVVVDVTDDYTYNTNDGNGPHLEGANVSLKGYYNLETIATGLTDENGLFTVENVPEGWYYLTINADWHKDYNSIVKIENGDLGRESHHEVYLQLKTHEYSWVVVPTEIEDEYEFELVAQIQTNVPVPVVVIDAPSEMDTLAYGDSIQFSISVTNHGLVDALDVQLTMPGDFAEYDFIPLFDHIDTLHAKTTVVIPVIYTRSRNARGREDVVCTSDYTELHYWMCNAQRRWDEYVRKVKIPFSEHCDPVVPTIVHGPSNYPGDYSISYIYLIGNFDNYHYPSLPIPSWVPDVYETIETFINTIDPPVVITPDDCEPCWKTIPSAIGHLGDIVGLGTIVDDILYGGELVETVSDFGNAEPGTLLTTNKDVTARYGRVVAGHGVGLIEGPVGVVGGYALGAMDLLDHIEGCITFTNPYRDDASLNTAVGQIELFTNYYQSLYNELTNLFQEEEWINERNIEDFLDQFITLLDTVDYTVPLEATQQLVEVCDLTAVNDSIVQRFSQRWNRSIQYWNAGIRTLADLPEGWDDNFIQLDQAMVQPMVDAIIAAEAMGFNHVGQMYESGMGVLQDATAEHTNDVCAKISVSFKQKMTMTREAFEGTLRVTNGHPIEPMESINVDIVIKDDDGVDRTDLFQINVKSLSQITGVDGTGTLEAQKEGVVQFEMIPTIEAAPDTSRYYSFGGSFTFLDPFSGEEMTYPLYPVRLKVNPSPNLHVDYFISRHIISDDPLTEDTIEATEPAELAMMIRNVGAGDANNVYLQSSQPQIIENQQGLLIQFNMVSSAMNGVPRPLGLTDIPFGTIASNTAGIAEWYFTSSLLARVVGTTPHVIHNNSYGNPNLSLVTELHSHVLIKAVNAYGSLEDGINDFLVDDNVDFSHTPDNIYFSHGGSRPVKKAVTAMVDGTLTNTNRVVQLKVTPYSAGWVYANVFDPAEGQYDIVSCTRDDGTEIPLSNVWTTWATMPDEGAPIHENLLHIFDTVATTQMVTYTLVYEPSQVTSQTTTLAEGWNWWSSYIDLTNGGLASLEEALADNAVMVKSQRNGFVTYDSGDWYGNLNALDNRQMYRIQTDTETEVTMSGHRTDLSQLTISTVEGWNWIGYPVPATQPIAEALSGLDAGNGDMLKSQTKFAVYDGDDGWFGGLTQMVPGQGYMYNGGQAHNFQYQSGRKTAVAESEEELHWNVDVHAYPDNMSVVAVVAIDGEEQRTEHLEVGAFSDGVTVGSASLLHNARRDRWYALVPVSGNGGGEVSFRLYDASTGYEFGTEAEEKLTFAADAVMGDLDQPVMLNFKALMGMDEQDEAMVRIYPNPVSKGGEIRLSLPADAGKARVEIHNILDVLVSVKETDGNTVTLGKAVLPGTYIVKVYTESNKVYYGKLIVK